MTINNLVGSERDSHDLHHFKRKYKLGPEIGRGGFGKINETVTNTNQNV
jgi:hypothetical protein